MQYQLEKIKQKMNHKVILTMPRDIYLTKLGDTNFLPEMTYKMDKLENKKLTTFVTNDISE